MFLPKLLEQCVINKNIVHQLHIKRYTLNFTVNEEQPLKLENIKWGQMRPSASNQSTDTAHNLMLF